MGIRFLLQGRNTPLSRSTLRFLDMWLRYRLEHPRRCIQGAERLLRPRAQRAGIKVVVDAEGQLVACARRMARMCGWADEQRATPTGEKMD